MTGTSARDDAGEIRRRVMARADYAAKSKAVADTAIALAHAKAAHTKALQDMDRLWFEERKNYNA